MRDRDRPLDDRTDAEPPREADAEPPQEADAPRWDDEYLDRVGDRLSHNYDLETDADVEGDRFALYGRMDLVSTKHVVHPSISIADHESTEHLFVQRVDAVDDRTLDRYVDLGHELADADEWLAPDEEHFSTEFTFVAVAPSIPDAVRERVAGFSERTLLKYGFHGHYEINLVVAAPDREALVASENADVATAFRLWEPIERDEPGLLGLLVRRLQL